MFGQQKYYQHPTTDKPYAPAAVITRIESDNIKLKMFINSIRDKSLREEDSLNDSDRSRIEMRSDTRSYQREDSFSQIRKHSRLINKQVYSPPEHSGDPLLRNKYRQNNYFKHETYLNKINQKMSSFHQGSSNTTPMKGFASEIPKQVILAPSYVKQASPQKKQSIFRIKSKIEEKTYKKELEMKSVSKAHIKNPQNQPFFTQKINAYILTSHLNAINPLHAGSIPEQIFTFFQSLYEVLKIPKAKDAVIKRYKNCIYFGERAPPNKATYVGMVWYYRLVCYIGELVDGKKHGQGVEVNLANQPIIWKGKFHDGHKTGYFSIESSDYKYFGMLRKGQYNGQGHLSTENSQYKGNFCDGVKEGFGFEKLKNKSQYRGEYFANKFDGQGELKATNYYYKGLFKNGKPDGHGFQRTDEYQYLGNFVMGKKQGKGKLKTSDGIFVECRFENGLIVDENKRKGTPVKQQKLQSYLSKELHALNQESDQGTIENMLSEINNEKPMLPQMDELSPINSAIFQK